MSTQHTVKQGEHLSGIAATYGFADWHALWDHPENAALKEKRKNPNVLFPDDQVFIPDKEQKKESISAGASHKFTLRKPKVTLRIALRGIDDHPLANTKCELQVDGKSFPVTSNGDGLVEQEVPAGASGGKLVVKGVDGFPDLDIPIKIGHLDPVEEISGQVARLNNLGYNAGPADEIDGKLFPAAVEEFQCDQGLTVDGTCGPKTQAKLREIHGC